MKRISLMTLVGISLLMLLLFSCNNDTSIGLFTGLAHPASSPSATGDAPLPPRSLIFYYEDTSTLYYRSYNKIFTLKDDMEATLLFETTSPFEGAIFHSEGIGMSMLMKTDGVQEGGVAFWEVKPLDADPVKKATPTFKNSDLDPDIQIDEMTAFRLLSPDYVIVEGMKNGKQVTTFAFYLEGTNEFELVSSMVATEGWKLEEVMHMSGFQLWGLMSSTPKIFIFSKGSERKYLYYNSPWYGRTLDFPHEIAAFVVVEDFDDDDNYYLLLLTPDGKLYGTGLSTIEQGNFALIHDTGQSYRRDAFMFTHQAWGEDTHIITRPKNSVRGVTVLSLDDDYVITDVTNLTTGYAKDLADATIISSFYFDRGDEFFYFDTVEKGFLKVTIDDPKSGAGSSQVVEGYVTE